MKKGIAIGLAALTALSAAAYAGFGMGPLDGNHPAEQNADLRQALEDGSYEDFVSTLSEINPEKAEGMTEELFARISGRMQAKEKAALAIESGDYDAFVEALSQASPKAAEGMTEEKFNEMVEQHAVRSALEEAVANEDYEAWAEAALRLPNGEALVEIVDKEDFGTFIEMRESRQGFAKPGLMHNAFGIAHGKGDIGSEGKCGRPNQLPGE